MSVQVDLTDLYRNNEREIQQLIISMIAQLQAAVRRAVLSDGTVSPARFRQLLAETRSIIMNVVVVVRGSGATPYTFTPNGYVIPLSPLMRILWQYQRQAMELAVQEQAAILRQYLEQSMINVLSAAHLSPFTPNARIPDQEAEALEKYQMPLTARRADGRTLDDRLLLAVGKEAAKFSALLRELVAEGKTEKELLDLIEVYYRAGLDRANKPYGKQGFTEILAITRSEPVWAYASAAAVMASTHPLVQRVRIYRTRSEACPICDPIADGSPYPTTQFPIPGYHAHCLCGMAFEVVAAPALMLEWIQTSDWLHYKGSLSKDFVVLLEMAQ